MPALLVLSISTGLHRYSTESRMEQESKYNQPIAFLGSSVGVVGVWCSGDSGVNHVCRDFFL